MASSNQAAVPNLPFSPRIISTPRSQVLNNTNTGHNIQSSLNFNNSVNKPSGSVLNVTLNGVSGLVNQNVSMPNNTEQPSFLGMLLSDALPSVSNNTGSGFNITVNGIPENFSQQLASNQQISNNTEYSKARIITAKARDISLTMARFPAPAPPLGPCPCCKEGVPLCPCRKPKSSTGTQYEDDPFMSKTYSKDECKTQGTQAFNEVSYRVRQVAQPLIAKYTPQDIRLAAHEVASYFPALSSCDADVIKFLSKKIRSFVKSQRKRKNRSTNKDKENANPLSIENCNELENVQGESDNENDESGNDVNMMEGHATTSPRKRCLSESGEPEPGESNGDKQTNIPPNIPAKKAKKTQVDPVPTSSDPQPSASDPVAKEFCSQNSQNVKFEEGHFVVLGKGVDSYEFCKVDRVVYHKEFRRYSLDVTYYEVLDGRLEVHPKRKKGKNVKPGKPWTGSKIPLNTIIFNLRSTRLVDSDIKRRLCEITKELYS